MFRASLRRAHWLQAPAMPLLRQDVSWLVLSTLIYCAMAFKAAHFVELSVRIVGLLAGPGAALAVWVTMAVRPSTYWKHRTSLLASMKMFRTAVVTYVVLRTENQLFRVGSQEGWWSLLLLSWYKAFMVSIVGLGFPLSNPTQLCTHLVGLACALITNRQRCAFECEVPHISVFYSSADGWLRAALGSTFPLAAGSKLDQHRLLEPPFTCVLVQSFAQLVVGFLLPALAVDWSKSMLRLGPFVGPGGSTALRQGTWESVLAYLGLLAVSAGAGWQALELLVNSWQRAALGIHASSSQ